MSNVDDVARRFVARAETDAGVVLPEGKARMLANVFAAVVTEAGMTRTGPTRPLGPSEVARALLQRSAATEHSSVKLSRNAKGDTQIEVTVRTGESDDVATVEDAAGKARATYDLLRGIYPISPNTPDAKGGD